MLKHRKCIYYMALMWSHSQTHIGMGGSGQSVGMEVYHVVVALQLPYYICILMCTFWKCQVPNSLDSGENSHNSHNM